MRLYLFSYRFGCSFSLINRFELSLYKDAPAQHLHGKSIPTGAQIANFISVSDHLRHEDRQIISVTIFLQLKTTGVETIILWLFKDDGEWLVR